MITVFVLAAGIVVVVLMVVMVKWLLRNADELFSWSPARWEHDDQSDAELKTISSRR